MNAHFGGRQGVQRTYETLKPYVTWPGIFQDVEKYITNSEIINLLVLIPKHLFKREIHNFNHGIKSN